MKAPDGFEQDKKTIREINIGPESEAVTLRWENYQIASLKRKIKIIKKSSLDNERLEGAEFIVRRESIHKERGPYEYLMQYISGDGETIYRGFVSNILLATHFTTNKDGEVVIEDLPDTKLELLEVKAPEGHVVENPVIPIEADQENDHIELEIKNMKEPQRLYKYQLEKVDKNNVDTALEGAEFVLKQHGFYYKGGSSLEDSSWTADIKEAHHFISNENGDVLIDTTDGFGFEEGRYLIEEVKAPEGYDLLEEDVEITIDESHLNKAYKIENSQTIPWTPIDPLGSFKVKKRNHQGESLEGAEFVLLHKGQYYTGDVDKLWTNNKDEAKKLISDAKGAFEVNSLPYGTYQLREIKAPAGYDLLEKDIEITINEQQNNQSYEVKNVKSTPWLPIEPLGSFAILKEDTEGNRLLGAKFILMHDGQYYTGNRESLWSSDQKEAKLLITNEKGFFRVDSLPYGHYILKEIEAPDGYQLLEDVLEFNIHDQLVEATYSVENKKVEPWTPIEPMASFEVEKVDTEGKHLEGAEFHLMYKGQYYTGKRDVMWTNDQKGAKVLVTDANGHFAVNSLPYGDYVLTEIKAPEGYALLEEPVKFSLDSTHFKESLRITNKKVEPWTPIEPMASFEVEKVDTEGKHLEGAEFHLMYKGQYYTGKRDAMWTSDQKGAKVLVTDANGHFAVSSLPYGDYVLTEIKAPEGYALLEEPVKFSLDAEKSQFSLKIENKAIDAPIIEEKLGKIRVYKVDADTQALLTGAQFVLKQDGLYYTGKAWSKYYKDALVLESNEHGFFEVNGLTMGVYELVEVKAPDGYVLNKEVIDFELSEDHFDKEIVVKNTPVKEKLPTTGISNTSTYIFIALIVIGMILYLWAKRRDR